MLNRTEPLMYLRILAGLIATLCSKLRMNHIATITFSKWLHAGFDFQAYPTNSISISEIRFMAYLQLLGHLLDTFGNVLQTMTRLGMFRFSSHNGILAAISSTASTVWRWHICNSRSSI